MRSHLSYVYLKTMTGGKERVKAKQKIFHFIFQDFIMMIYLRTVRKTYDLDIFLRRFNFFDSTRLYFINFHFKDVNLQIRYFFILNVK